MEVDNKVKVTFDIEPELEAEIAKIKEKYGVTDEDILNLGICKMLSGLSMDELLDHHKTDEDKLRCIESHLHALEQSKELLERVIEIKESEQ
jgi:hypothetical protein